MAAQDDDVDVPSPVSVEGRIVDYVAVITFSHGTRNALNYELVERIVDALAVARQDGARAAVLRTDSRHFCAGADFVRSRPSGEAGPHISEVVARLYQQELPLVAALRGAVVGGGLGLALAADFRVASADSYAWANFNRIGISPGFGLTVTLPRLVGAQQAADLFYTGRRLDADEAKTAGLFDRVVTAEQLDAAALELATTIAGSAPLAVHATRQMLRADLLADLLPRLSAEREAMDPLFATEDFREGVQAWRYRRPPAFRAE